MQHTHTQTFMFTFTVVVNLESLWEEAKENPH